MSAENRNEYLDQVVAQQAQLENAMRSKRSAPTPAAPAAAPGGPARGYAGPVPPPPPDSGRPPGSAVDVRITGWWRWKTVLVPPNAFVVHTRRGAAEPLHVGLGTSFRYNPATDSFLVVPGAMQTILINAFCICKELQGVLVQAYVQWIIQDFRTAYKKLDFGDLEDPMRLVNLQLKEQAEAAIKDKVATMGVHEVLSDKQPIIEELTARLRSVAEGEGGSDTGLGLRIVTVQIKEAVVSSSRLWENLQKPYRSEQERIAKLASLTAEEAVSVREMEVGRERESRHIETERELGELRARNAAVTFDREAGERVRRAEREQNDARTLAELENETAAHALNLERERHEAELQMARLRLDREQELARLGLEHDLALQQSKVDASHQSGLLELERHRIRAAIDNEQSAANIQAKLVRQLPDIVAKLPKPTELRSVNIGGGNGTTVSGVLAELTAVVDALRTASRDRGN
jgi:hypothetical protein